jgi:proteic killer suppression protein
VINTVTLSPRAQKDLRKCPSHIVRNLMAWIGAVQAEGLEAIRRMPGYHDEPLHGLWKGHRSIRLSLAYRAIYIVQDDGIVEFALVETVNKHLY